MIDKFTNMSFTRQRKWQLRHPEKAKIIQDRYIKCCRIKNQNKRKNKKTIEKEILVDIFLDAKNNELRVWRSFKKVKIGSRIYQ